MSQDQASGPIDVVLISTYELGRQPFGLASALAYLRAAGLRAIGVDTAVQPLPEELVKEAQIVGFYLPMHTATRLAAALVPRVRRLQPRARLIAFGLYAPMNANWLHSLGISHCIGGEFEEPLKQLCLALLGRSQPDNLPSVQVSLQKQRFFTPHRETLPAPPRYAQLVMPDGQRKLTGYTETSRGCKHLCRHCPVVPVYQGRFRVVPREVVLEDIRQQVAMGVQHITFGDPDFFNGPGHGLRIVRQMHQEFPQLSYDVTIKIEHLLRYRKWLPVLKETGCVLITSAVESLDDAILARLAKGHTRADFLLALEILGRLNLPLNPTFVPFTPWVTREGYRDFLLQLAQLGLVNHVQPIQLGIRLLIPEGSHILHLPEAQEWITCFEPELLSYTWKHPDPLMDELQAEVMELIQQGTCRGETRAQIFHQIWERTHAYLGEEPATLPELEVPDPVTIPYLTEPWYC